MGQPSFQEKRTKIPTRSEERFEAERKYQRATERDCEWKECSEPIMIGEGALGASLN